MTMRDETNDVWGEFIDTDDFKKGCRECAIGMMRQKPDVYVNDLFMSEIIDDTEVDDEKD